MLNGEPSAQNKTNFGSAKYIERGFLRTPKRSGREIVGIMTRLSNLFWSITEPSAPVAAKAIWPFLPLTTFSETETNTDANSVGIMWEVVRST